MRQVLKTMFDHFITYILYLNKKKLLTIHCASNFGFFSEWLWNSWKQKKRKIEDNYRCLIEFFFPSKIEAKNFEIQFFQKISNKIVLFDSKYEFRMISAFIWYAYCPCRWKIIIFQKSACQNLENFSVKLGHFGVASRKNYSS